MKQRLTTILLLAVVVSLPAIAEVKLPTFFSDGMVMQQQTQANLWGTATPRKQVTVDPGWDNKTYTTTADAQGNWKLSVPTPAAGGPYTITISDGKELILNNILIGELWICSGQSNMEMPMKGFKNQPIDNSNMDVLRSKNPNLRLFTAKRTSTLKPQHDVVGQWNEATPASVYEFSATAYYFGRLVQEITDVPVGLIVIAWGGSAAEAWMTGEWLKAFPDAKIPRTEEDIKSKNRTPTVLYNGMLHPLIGISMRGVIWYQGEDNYNRAHTYADMFTALVNGWRSEWKQGDFPFYYCQIAPYDYGIITEPGKEVINSAYLREAQMQAEHRLTNTGMAVLLDVGMEKGIHPTQKQIAGERLAFLALNKTYGIEGVEGDSPYYKSMEIQGDTAIITFERSLMWLNAKDGESKLFTIAGEDKVFYPARAWISRSKVHVKSDKVQHPVAVRYAFENYVKGDLYGGNGLPVSSFRTDNW
ncbi:sialate O-acetylesterase [Bacteroides sp. 51]|uniref:sialate O-acetylesterase n=1 Tax=Bacteroides sp. 51 TaxID=2302938 RepID=UPI0013D6C620|nr:sialate O-acetylesterase [Bacteroides sp. 51]NDV82020.1 sialate O-acetylesterase [Bacteroides sp. 51]